MARIKQELDDVRKGLGLLRNEISLGALMGVGVTGMLASGRLLFAYNAAREQGILSDQLEFYGIIGAGSAILQAGLMVGGSIAYVHRLYKENNNMEQLN